MKKSLHSAAWGKAFERSWRAIGKAALTSSAKARIPPPGEGDWVAGAAIGAEGVRRFRLYKPPGLLHSERLPLMVMLHGCGQDARSFAMSTRMNRLALRERFLVLYPEQDRLANGQGCWNWFDTSSGRAFREAALIMKAIEQVCWFQPIDRSRIAIAGLSAGASMAALLVSRHPERFKAVVMHSGIAPGTAHSTMSALGAMHGFRATKPLAAMPEEGTEHWPPLMVIHGSADAVVSPHNALAAAEAWSDAVGAKATKARTVQRGQRYPMVVTDFKRKGSTVATLVEVHGLAHAWSGGALNKPHSDAQGPDASRMVWAFALKQFRA